jgi:formylglycine-generating enzyme required for sulfatase activity
MLRVLLFVYCFVQSQTLIAQQKEVRVALVIGNSAYKQSPLRNPANDARDMAVKLRSLGFTVIERSNLGIRQIGSTLREFRAKLTPGSVALVFYAGHGLQIKGENYLPAVDAEITGEEDVQNQSLAMRQIMDVLSDAKTRLNLVFLDACRDNPYARSFRSASRGLSKENAPSGTLISFATRPGSVAADGSGRNGVYTGALLAAMNETNRPIEQVLKSVVTAVKAQSKNQQEPWMEGSIEGEFCFGDCNRAVAQSSTPELSATQLEEKFWDEAKGVGNREAFEAYLSTYPKGRYVSLAKATIARLNVAGAQVASGSNPAPIRPQPPLQTASIAPQPGTVFKDCDDCPEMVTIPAGNFLMGSKGDPFSSDPPNASEQPQHSVSIRSFALGKFEVTQEQWYAVMGTMPSKFKGRTLPVEQVSWEDAQVFVQKLSANTGKKYRLPTEAEWEYAARAGSQTNDYFFDYQTKFARQIQLGLYAWFANNSSTTKPIGQKLPNAFGLHDMQGNVWEWTQDCWNENYNSAPNNGSAWTRGDCSNRVMRGGGWRGDPTFWDVAFRSKDTVTHRNVMVGFRVARDH